MGEEFICKYCGAPLDHEKAVGGVVRCVYCNNAQTVPKKDVSPAALSFLRMGEHDLDTCKFDEAYTAYQKAAELDEKEPEAYFGMALAAFKVQYLKDEVNERLQPICHEISEKVFSGDKNFRRALELATDEQKREYLARAEEIDHIRKEFYALKESGLDYDCFLCVKVSDEHGGTTQDSHEALKLYHHLKEQGYAPFYSEEEAQRRTGGDYEALILYALYTSECMLIVCSNEEYLQTKWVKNEYTRFAKMIANEEKSRDAVSFVFKGAPIEHLPGKEGKIQGIDLSKPDAYTRIEGFLERHRTVAAPATIERKEYGSGSYKKKQAQRQGVTKRELNAIGGGELSVSDRSKLNIAKEFIKRGDYPTAIRFLDNMLKGNAGNGEAYFLHFLAENKCASESDFEKGDFRAQAFGSLENAISATQDTARRKAFYEVLYRHILSAKDIDAYKEYIELPESEEGKIANATEVMYQEALSSTDLDMFMEIVKTVTDTDRYIEMNLTFAHAVALREAIPCYRNILNADEGHAEARYYVFYSDAGAEDGAVLAYCSAEENAADVEEKLFSYGYNAFAAEKLFALCLKYAGSETEKACRLFDFVFSMTPKSQDGFLQEQLRKMFEELLRAQKVDRARTYNELLLSLDPLAHEAYFNRVLFKNGCLNPLGLIDFGKELLEDKDYFSAINSYAEKYPEKANLYLDIEEALKELASKVSSPMCREYLKENVFVPAEEIPSCLRSVLQKLGDEAKRCFDKVLQKYNCNFPKGLLSLLQDITRDSDMVRAVCFAEVGECDCGETILETYYKQGAKSKANRKDWRDEKIAVGLIVAAAAAFFAMLASLVAAASGDTYAYPFFATTFGLGGSRIKLVGYFALIPLLIFIIFALVYLIWNRNRLVCNIMSGLILVMTLSIVFAGAIKVCTGKQVVYYGNGYTLMATRNEDGTVSIRNAFDLYDSAYRGSKTQLIIPNKIRGYNVSTIGECAFRDRDKLTDITIGGGVTTIDANAFYDCNGLASVTVGDGVTTIGEYAFRSCDRLSSVTIGDGVTTINEGAFYDCNGLKRVTFGDGVTTIGEYALCSCDKLLNVTLGDGVTTIGGYAFSLCDGLKIVTIGRNVNMIKEYAFWDCRNLEELHYNGSMQAWQEIQKDNKWNRGTGDYTVICTDGVLAKDGSVISA